jgi:hypothetical protein
MKKLSTILICIALTSCSVNKGIVSKTENRYKATPTMKYFNKKLNGKKYGLS